ncbi:hypothetical protein [uncultured Megasphaera sp.]|uniref:hypothetical protein n=1 Tax=uncultured Megasphaera sp. TaxID=165188 RepID=UPI0025CC3CE4|nr:hypothetical protein [uncultured Megasphaera sp.]
MKHFYTEIENITLVFDDIKTNQDGMDSISLHFEKPIEDGFAFLDTSLPTLYVEKTYGFSAQFQRRKPQDHYIHRPHG